MRIIWLVLGMALSIGLPACQAGKSPLLTQTYHGAGVVEGVDTANGKLKIKHGDIPGFMEAMTMDYAMRDRARLADFAVGDQVEFWLQYENGITVLTQVTKMPAQTAAAPNGAEIYAQNCARCHGAQGEGAEKGLPLASGHALHHGEDEMKQQVANGKTGKMPAFKDKLTPEQVNAVVQYVRGQIQKNQPSADDHKHTH